MSNRNKNKKSDNLRDVVLSKKNPSQADVGELFQDRSLSGQLRFKKGINDFLTLLSEAQIQALISAIPSPEVPTTTVVNISSAQILSMGTTPIELLPAPGAGKYYEYEMRIEYSWGTAAYTTAHWWIANSNSYAGSVIDSIYLETANSDRVYTVNSSSPVNTLNLGFADVTAARPIYLDEPVVLTTSTGANPTLGDGTLRVIITYTERTFGA